MNRVHDYTTGPENQLAVLERLGVLQVNWIDYERNAIPRDLAAANLTAAEREERKRITQHSQGQREAAKPGPLLPRNPDRMRRLSDPYDSKLDVAERTRSYLQANCAHCHVEAGGGNSLMDLEFTTQLKNMRIVDVKPQHHTFDIADVRLIAPGHPERSALLHRVADREAGHMPPLATSVVDQQAVDLLTKWIRSLPAER